MDACLIVAPVDALHGRWGDVDAADRHAVLDRPRPLAGSWFERHMPA